VHPGSPNDVNCLNAYNFLSHFNKIFTLNYDLLLYWALMRGWEKEREERNETTGSDYNEDTPWFCDGFGERAGQLVWLVKRADDVTVWYLHGALHLYLICDDESYYLEKLRYQESVNLIEQIRQNIDDEKLPLVVAEGKSSRKKFQIDQYSYLRYAYNALKTLSGILFTFGVSFREEDQHILEAIHESELSDVYIGVYEPKAGKLGRIKDRIEEIQEAYPKEKPTYHFYDSGTVHPWNFDPTSLLK